MYVHLDRCPVTGVRRHRRGVDDDRDGREATAGVVELWGYDMYAAESGTRHDHLGPRDHRLHERRNRLAWSIARAHLRIAQAEQAVARARETMQAVAKPSPRRRTGRTRRLAHLRLVR